MNLLSPIGRGIPLLVMLFLVSCRSSTPAPRPEPRILVLKPFTTGNRSHSPALSPAELERQLNELVNRIEVGMRRQEVEHMLPRSETAGYTSSTTITGGAQGVRYLVAPGYWVTVFYDYTGVPRDAAGTALATSSSDNRVMQKPVLGRGP